MPRNVQFVGLSLAINRCIVWDVLELSEEYLSLSKIIISDLKFSVKKPKEIFALDLTGLLENQILKSKGRNRPFFNS